MLYEYPTRFLEDSSALHTQISQASIQYSIFFRMISTIQDIIMKCSSMTNLLDKSGIFLSVTFYLADTTFEYGSSIQ
jgi:hypothetical protein